MRGWLASQAATAVRCVAQGAVRVVGETARAAAKSAGLTSTSAQGIQLEATRGGMGPVFPPDADALGERNLRSGMSADESWARTVFLAGQRRPPLGRKRRRWQRGPSPPPRGR